MKRTGVRLRAFAARWFDARTMERVIDPAVADLQAEYEDAVRHHRPWRARWIWVSGHVAFAKVVLWHEGRRLIHAVEGATPAERRALSRTWACASAVTAFGTLLLVTFAFGRIVPDDHGSPRLLFLLLIPQALLLAVPLGLAAGILWSLPSTRVSGRCGLFVLLVASTASVASFLIGEWIVPEANQAFRVSVFGAPIAKGAHELTLGELRRFIRADTAPPPADVRHLALVYHARWAVSGAPLVLCVFALAVARRWRSRRWSLVCAGVAVAGYFVIGHVARSAFDGGLPRAAAAWAPNAALMIAALALWTRYPSQPARERPSST